MDQAWETDSPATRSKWARKVLEIDPNELSAYMLLSEATQVRRKKIALLHEGVRRGEKIWAQEIKRPSHYDFWLDMDSRPYMRCLHCLAVVQWDDGDRDEAVKNAKMLL